MELRVDLGDLAEKYGVETNTGSRILAFDCPWIQGRNDEGGGRTSHCIGGMYQIVEVLSKDAVLKDSSTTGVDMTMSPSEDLDVETMNAAASSAFSTVGSSIFLLASCSMLL